MMITVDSNQAGPLNLNPSFVFWNYNGKIITYDRERGGTVVIRFEILR